MSRDDERDRLWRDDPAAWQQQPLHEARRGAADREIEPPQFLIPADRVYVPYETRSRPETLIILFAKLDAQCPAYPHLNNFRFDHHYGQSFTLLYPFLTVVVTGQRLGEIAHAINARKCAIIREWHRDLYDPPTRGIPVIESISFSVPGEEIEPQRG